MLVIWEDWKKRWELSKINLTWKSMEEIQKEYDWMYNFAKELLDKYRSRSEEYHSRNKLIQELKLQLWKERKELKEEIRNEMKYWKYYSESKIERDKRLKEEFMKLL